MRSSERCSRDSRRGCEDASGRGRNGEGAKEARRDALRGVAGALEEVREDLTVLGAKLEELRETEVGNDEETSDDAEETSDDAEETSDDAEETSDDADVDEK